MEGTVEQKIIYEMEEYFEEMEDDYGSTGHDVISTIQSIMCDGYAGKL